MKLTVTLDVKTWIEISCIEHFEDFDIKEQEYYRKNRTVTKTFLNTDEANAWLTANKNTIFDVVWKECKEL